MGADLTDDDGVSRLAGLDDVDAQAFVGRAVALPDVRLDAEVLALVPDVVLVVVSFDRVGRRVRHEIMRSELAEEIRPGCAQSVMVSIVFGRFTQVHERLENIVGVDVARLPRGLDGTFSQDEPSFRFLNRGMGRFEHGIEPGR